MFLMVGVVFWRIIGGWGASDGAEFSASNFPSGCVIVNVDCVICNENIGNYSLL
jgi:hypothetical protein